MDVLSEFRSLVDGYPESLKPELFKSLKAAPSSKQVWIPSPGPQTEAYFSPADVMLYGGQGGGGKTDLGLGLGFTQHHRTAIIRRVFANLAGIVDRGKELVGERSFRGGSITQFKYDGRLVRLLGCQHLGDEQSSQGIAYDLKVFDEATQFLEMQVRFHMGWVRSVIPGQRKRVVLATNPPLNSDGDWIIPMFGPWLDITHHRPAKPGELRWYVSCPDPKDPKRIIDIPVDGPPVLEHEDDRPPPFQRSDLNGGAPLEPLSRTFIPAALKDNPYLIDTGYQAQLDALPEPMRSAVRDGNFMATREDDANQVIPTEWIVAAQARWTSTIPQDQAMTTIAVDVAQGGPDRTVITPRYGWYFAQQIAVPGKETPDGSSVVGLIIKHRKDAAIIVGDAGGGYWGSTKDRLTENAIPSVAYNGASPTNARTRDGLLGFWNVRAAAHWRMREELDPDQEGGSVIALPPDPELRSDLAACRFEMTTRGYRIEDKADIKKRLGRSPDKGDSAVIALWEGQRQAQRARRRDGRFHLPTSSNMGFSHMKKGGAYGRS